MVVEEVDESPSLEVNPPPNENPNGDENPSDKGKTKGRKRDKSPPVLKNGKWSFIWEHFTKLEPTDPKDSEEILKCICNYCGNDFPCDSRNNENSHLWNHFKNVCEFNLFKMDEKKQKVSSFEIVKGGKDEETSLVAMAYSKEACRLALDKYIVLDDLSIKHVEGEGFKQFVRILQPRFEIPSRMIVAKDVLKLYYEEKVNLKNILKHERVSITIDTWTSIQNLNYMAITVHWVDHDFQYQKRIINFCQVIDHRGETIDGEIGACLNDWSISKLFAVTVNNSSSNEDVIKYLKGMFKDKEKGLILDGKFLHVRCCAYIVNLIVSEAIKEKHDSIAAIRHAVKFVRSSRSRLETFKECVKKERIECKGLLCLDVQRSWNSTFQMLTCALKFRRVFKRMELDANYLIYFDEVDKDGKPMEGPPSEIDWENASLLVRFLETFYDVTLKFSGSTNVTSNKYFIEICNMQHELNELALDDDEDQLLVNMAKNMKLKYDKYWGNIDECNEILLIALVFDPRYKIQYLSHCFNAFHDPITSFQMVRGVEQTIRAMFDQYNGATSRFESSMIQSQGQAIVGGSSSFMRGRPIVNKSRNLHDEFVQQKKAQDGGRTMNEVDRYFSEDAEDMIEGDTFDVLKWWAGNACKYKILSLIARDVLAIPVTAVSSETAFSIGGQILDPFRSSLSPKMVEASICLKNWWSESHQPIIIKNYMDEAEVLETSEYLEADTTASFINAPSSASSAESEKK